jgi:hypothetical protein
MKKLIPKVTSIRDLRNKSSDPRYEALTMAAARNLGGTPKTLAAAFQWLETNAMETSEAGVVKEINFCRDLI